MSAFQVSFFQESAFQVSAFQVSAFQGLFKSALANLVIVLKCINDILKLFLQMSRPKKWDKIGKMFTKKNMPSSFDHFDSFYVEKLAVP